MVVLVLNHRVRPAVLWVLCLSNTNDDQVRAPTLKSSLGRHGCPGIRSDTHFYFLYESHLESDLAW